MKKLILILCVLVAPLVQAQNFEVSPDRTNLTVDGTSSIHDWTIKATEFKGTATIELDGAQLGEIKNLTFTVPVKSLESGKSGMDDNTYEALKAKKHPNITYQFLSIENSEKKGNQLILDTKGNLTVAGTTKTINMKVVTDVSNGVVFSGSTSFKMTDFNIDPPTAVFGTIKTGDKVTINFKANYTK